MKITLTPREGIEIELDSSMCDDVVTLDVMCRGAADFANQRITMGHMLHQTNEERDKRSEEIHRAIVSQMDVEKSKESFDKRMVQKKQEEIDLS
jgi:hypothetical protein